MKQIFRKTIFWENLKRSLAVFTGPATYAIHELGAADDWMLTAALLSFTGGLISIWMTDHDNDGTVDLFE